MASVSLQVVIEQKTAEATPYVIVPAARIARWKLDATTTIEGTLDGAALGRRSLKRLDDAHWFVELPRGILATIGKRSGDRAALCMTPASAALPEELEQLIASDAAARARWDAFTDAQKRMLREHLLEPGRRKPGGAGPRKHSFPRRSRGRGEHLHGHRRRQRASKRDAGGHSATRQLGLRGMLHDARADRPRRCKRRS